MSDAAFLKFKKLKGGDIIAVAARHNRRDIQAEIGASGSIDSTRSHLNETLRGPPTADGVAQLAKNLLATAGVVKIRKNGVMGIEVVFSLPPNHRLNDRDYFIDCVSWAEAYFGGAENLLSADIHRDEGAPHCHVLLLPLVQGRMNGHALCGGPKEVLAMQCHFHEAVAKQHGLRKAPARLSATDKQVATAKVMALLKTTSDTALQSQVWATIKTLIEREPGPFLTALGLEMETPTRKLKPFVNYVTSPGRGPKRESEDRNAISFSMGENKQREKAVLMTIMEDEKTQPICSVSFPKITPLPLVPNATDNVTPLHAEVGQPDGSMATSEPIALAAAQPLSDVPNSDGEIAAPAHLRGQFLTQDHASESLLVGDNMKLKSTMGGHELPVLESIVDVLERLGIQELIRYPPNRAETWAPWQPVSDRVSAIQAVI